MTKSDWEIRFEHTFGTYDENLKVINRITVPTKESLEYRDEFMKFYEQMKVFVEKERASATSQGAREAVIKIQTHFFQLWEDDIDTISIKKVIDYLNSISPSKEVEEK